MRTPLARRVERMRPSMLRELVAAAGQRSFLALSGGLPPPEAFPVEARQPGSDPERTSYGSFCSFNDPDANLWIVQEVTTRLPGRE